jgi:hypothetical protein
MSGAISVINCFLSTSGLKTAVGPHVLISVTLHGIGLIYILQVVAVCCSQCAVRVRYDKLCN